MSNPAKGTVHRVGSTFVWELAPKTSWKTGSVSKCDSNGKQQEGAAGCNGHQCFIGKCLCSDGSCTQAYAAGTHHCPSWSAQLENSEIRTTGKNLQFAEYDKVRAS